MGQEEWAENYAQEVPPEHEEELLVQMTTHWNKFSREGVESPSLEIFQSHLDTILCPVPCALCWAYWSREVAPDDPMVVPSSLIRSVICDFTDHLSTHICMNVV
ncbi:hypothetical protein DUI87_06903 [Hirundo rustica rustica]|uniref:Uncharacterized protein n=1 Tax=Hirundo rustica rustica TaxID=333673 RepID=A0A3M0KVC2_HIRRU|nr:hypothetical protein DUI87_06903 [Hirundo rustica rustica]